MGFPFKPKHIKRYHDIARLLVKYGHGDLLAQAGLEDSFIETPSDRDEKQDPKAEELAKDLESMGPIFVKLGQVLSSRADLLPQPYLDALSRLQDNLEPFSFAEVEEIVQSELGVRLSKGFQEFDAEPLATASLGQVHRAILRDGRQVAVKIQRPGVRERVGDDFEVLSDIVDFVDAHTEIGRRYRFADVMDEFKKNLIRELDYRREAQNLKQFKENMQEFERIVVPGPIDDYCTSKVLTMDFIQGKKINTISPLAQMEMDGREMGDQVFRAYLKQILVDGVFHADPHPGNILVTPDYRVAIIDLGMIGYISESMQEDLLRLLLAISEGDGDRAAEISLKIGERLEGFDERTFKRRVAELITQNQNSSVEEIKIGKVMLDYSRVSGECLVRMPSELTMLSKTLLNLDEVGRSLDPDFNPNEAIRRHSAQLTQQRLSKSLTPAGMFAAAMEAKEFAQEFPNRVNKILDQLANNQMKIQVEALDEVSLIEGFQKVANRITTGLILAALIVGASQMMQVRTRFQIMGYPGLAILLFLAAAGGGFWLLISIMLNDRDTHRRGKSHPVAK